MKKLLLILFVLFAFKSFSQVPNPSVQPQKNNYKLFIYGQYLEVDSGFIFPKRDTGFRPSKPMLVYWQHAGVDTTFWYYNMRKWQKIGTIYAGSGLTKQADSNYVRFGGTITVDPSLTISNQSLRFNISKQGAASGQNGNGSVNAYTGVTDINNPDNETPTLFLPNATLSTLNVIGSGIDTITNTTRFGSSNLALLRFDYSTTPSNDTLKITNSNYTLKSNLAAISSLVSFGTTDTTKFADLVNWMHDSIEGIRSQVQIPNMGKVNKFTDFKIYNPYLLDSVRSTSFKIGNRTGIEFPEMKGTYVDTGVAINQLGVLDSVVFNSSLIYTRNTPTATAAYSLGLDANGKQVKFVGSTDNYAFTTLTDGATITWDMSVSNNAKVTLGGDRTLVITNAIVGKSYTIHIYQDATGGRDITIPVNSKVPIGFGSGATQTLNLTATALAYDVVTVQYDGTNYNFFPVNNMQ